MDDTIQPGDGNWLLLSIAVLTVLVYFWSKSRGQAGLRAIPTVGHSGFLTSYIGGIKYLLNASDIIKEGYEKHYSSIFKVPNVNRWVVIVAGTKMVEELRKAGDDELSFIEAANEMVQIPYTLGKQIATDPYHVNVLITQLTRNLHLVLPELREEIINAFETSIPPGAASEWVQVPAMEMVMDVICRASNRIFVGLPLCRNKEYIAINVAFAREVLAAAIVVSMFPKFLRPLAARFLTSLPRKIACMRKFLGPIIAERERKVKMYGKDYPNKPNDLLTWLMEEAKGRQKTVEDLTLRVLAVNFAAIHTSSMNFTHALYNLAANSQYAEPMREEIQDALRSEWWTKGTIDKMRKVDSFLKETMRFSNLRSLSMMRKVMKPITFSDGTNLPAGTLLFAAAEPLHFDSRHYENPEKFDAFRFVHRDDLDNDSGLEDSERRSAGGARHQLVTTTADYLAWGYGRRACPGRFFAAVELKMMLAHLLMRYDIRVDSPDVVGNEAPGERPKDFVIEANRLPNQTAKVWIRQRSHSNPISDGGGFYITQNN